MRLLGSTVNILYTRSLADTDTHSGIGLKRPVLIFVNNLPT